MDHETPTHPLIAKEIRNTGSWQEWKEQWERNRQSDIALEGLIRYGWNVRTANKEEEIERALLYLDIADGHLSAAHFAKESGCAEKPVWTGLETLFGNVMGLSEIRLLLAKRAFEALSLKFFRKEPSAPHYRKAQWLELIEDARVFEKIVWFLRSAERGTLGLLNLRNLPDSMPPEAPHSDAFRAFVMDFVQKTWGRKFDEARVEMLAALGKLELLLDEATFPLSHAGYLKLQKIAFGTRYRFPNGGASYRAPQSLEEASLAGSEAARIALILGANRRERRRLLGITAPARETGTGELKVA
ncbi:MAG: hypothetical protein Q8Q36_00610 [bacterium]|nr:hypothetical protein [bacterium]